MTVQFNFALRVNNCEIDTRFGNWGVILNSFLRNRAFTLRDGEIHQEVDALRLAIADRDIAEGGDGPLLRRSAVWKFRTQRTGTHFFVTSFGIQSEMKGTVHPTEAHFGFSKPMEQIPETWIGPPPSSRHFHVLRIRDLQDGEYQHVMGVSIPGFALLETPQPFDRGKIVTWSNPHPRDCQVTFGLTVVQGDWKKYRDALLEESSDSSVLVGLLTGDSERFGLVSFNLTKYSDAQSVIANMERNLALISQGATPKIPEEELSVLLWMEREENDPIRMIELGGVRASPDEAT
jgi:hypothetical protein